MHLTWTKKDENSIFCNMSHLEVREYDKENIIRPAEKGNKQPELAMLWWCNQALWDNIQRCIWLNYSKHYGKKTSLRRLHLQNKSLGSIIGRMSLHHYTCARQAKDMRPSQQQRDFPSGWGPIKLNSILQHYRQRKHPWWNKTDSSWELDWGLHKIRHSGLTPREVLSYTHEVLHIKVLWIESLQHKHPMNTLENWTRLKSTASTEENLPLDAASYPRTITSWLLRTKRPQGALRIRHAISKVRTAYKLPFEEEQNPQGSGWQRWTTIGWAQRILLSRFTTVTAPHNSGCLWATSQDLSYSILHADPWEILFMIFIMGRQHLELGGL